MRIVGLGLHDYFAMLGVFVWMQANVTFVVVVQFDKVCLWYCLS